MLKRSSTPGHTNKSADAKVRSQIRVGSRAPVMAQNRGSGRGLDSIRHRGCHDVVGWESRPVQRLPETMMVEMARTSTTRQRSNILHMPRTADPFDYTVSAKLQSEYQGGRRGCAGASSKSSPSSTRLTLAHLSLQHLQHQDDHASRGLTFTKAVRSDLKLPGGLR